MEELLGFIVRHLSPDKHGQTTFIAIENDEDESTSHDKIKYQYLSEGKVKVFYAKTNFQKRLIDDDDFLSVDEFESLLKEVTLNINMDIFHNFKYIEDAINDRSIKNSIITITLGKLTEENLPDLLSALDTKHNMLVEYKECYDITDGSNNLIYKEYIDKKYGISKEFRKLQSIDSHIVYKTDVIKRNTEDLNKYLEEKNEILSKLSDEERLLYETSSDEKKS